MNTQKEPSWPDEISAIPDDENRNSFNAKKFLVTGAAGFIGFFLSRSLLAQGHHVDGVDNLNDYYDVTLKKDRLAILEGSERFTFHLLDISDREKVAGLFRSKSFNVVIHLAAQAGVRYSIENPHAYIDSNLVGFANILEGCRHERPDHLIYASSSSVYGMNKKVPFATEDPVDHPVSLYAATKKSNELLAHAYSHLYGISMTGLRFFTVYGPWGRPDMAYFKFTKAIIEGVPIDVYNHGRMRRDFTYIDDIVTGITGLIAHALPEKGAGSDASNAPYAIYNIGNNQPVSLLTFIEILEDLLGRKAKKNMMPMQPGDVPETYADIDALKRLTGFQPATRIEDGLKQFVEWFQMYY